MALWSRNKKTETRNIQDPSVPVSSEAFLEFFGLGEGMSSAGVSVTIDNAMGVPAIWAAVNFLAGTIAGLPLKHYRKTEEGRQEVKGPLSKILHKAINDEMSSFEWRKYSFERTFTGGRQFTYIERSGEKVVNLFPLDPTKVKAKIVSGRKVYAYQQPGKRVKNYPAKDIIDIPFSLKADQISSLSPIMSNKDTIGLAIAATNYGSKFFDNGGVPPFVLTGNFATGAGLKRASDDMQEAIKKASKEKRLALSLPSGHDIKQIGADPEKSQLVELKKFLIEEVARIYSLPPNFLQDLSRATFSNVEQQDLHLVKHTIKRWIEQAEQEMNLKLFGRDNDTDYVEFNLDGLLRGDFKTRMEGYAQAIQNSIYTPAQVHEKENLPKRDEADVLLIQGATVPLSSQPTESSSAAPTKGNNNGS